MAGPETVLGLSLSGALATPVFRYLDTVGNGSGDTNANGDYSSAAEEFLIAPATGEVIRLERIIVTVEDAGNYAATDYGALAALTNGVSLQKRSNPPSPVTELDITDGQPITTNAEWSKLAGIDVDLKTWGSGNSTLVVRFTFSKSGVPLRLVGDSDEYFAVVLSDNLTGLVNHKFMVHGYYEP